MYCSRSEVQCVLDHLSPSGRHQYFSSNTQMPKPLEWNMNYWENSVVEWETRSGELCSTVNQILSRVPCFVHRNIFGVYSVAVALHHRIIWWLSVNLTDHIASNIKLFPLLQNMNYMTAFGLCPWGQLAHKVFLGWSKEGRWKRATWRP